MTDFEEINEKELLIEILQEVSLKLDKTTDELRVCRKLLKKVAIMAEPNGNVLIEEKRESYSGVLMEAFRSYGHTGTRVAPTGYGAPKRLVTVGIVPMLYLQRKFISKALFRNDTRGASVAITTAVAGLIEQGLITEVDKDTLVNVHSFGGRAFTLNKEYMKPDAFRAQPAKIISNIPTNIDVPWGSSRATNEGEVMGETPRPPFSGNLGVDPHNLIVDPPQPINPEDNSDTTQNISELIPETSVIDVKASNDIIIKPASEAAMQSVLDRIKSFPNSVPESVTLEDVEIKESYPIHILTVGNSFSVKIEDSDLGDIQSICSSLPNRHFDCIFHDDNTVAEIVRVG